MPLNLYESVLFLYLTKLQRKSKSFLSEYYLANVFIKKLLDT